MRALVPATYTIEDQDTGSIHNARGRLVSRVNNTSFLLSNRSWKEVDHCFSKVPQRVLRSLLGSASIERPVTVLDIGSGEQSRAANDLLRKYKTQNSLLHVIGVDLVHALDRENAVDRVQADALSLPLKSRSVDMAYSRQSLCHLTEDNQDTLKKCFSEVARVLTDGGLFFFDHSDYPSYRLNDERLQDCTPENTSLYSVKAGFFGGPLARLQNKIYQNRYSSEYVTLVAGNRPAIVHELVDSGDMRQLTQG